MRDYVRKETVAGPFPADDPIDKLAHYYDVNGYELITSTRGPKPDELIIEVPVEAEEAEEAEDAKDAKDAEDGEETEEAEDAEDAEEDIVLIATFQRGIPGAGWKTSNMTKLHSKVTARIQGDKILIDYVVDAAGQMKFTDEDELFWKREAEAAKRFVRGDGPLRDWRESEQERAKEVRGDFISIGVWLALLVFLFIVMFVLAF